MIFLAKSKDFSGTEKLTFSHGCDNKNDSTNSMPPKVFFAAKNLTNRRNINDGTTIKKL